MKPRKISAAFTTRIHSLMRTHNIERPEGYSIYGTDTRRGWCRPSKGFITIPLWTAKRGEGYMLYYLCHELAHAFSGTGYHNAAFMEWFMIICPTELWHHELGYKPRAAKAAGILPKAA